MKSKCCNANLIWFENVLYKGELMAGNGCENCSNFIDDDTGEVELYVR